MANYELLLKPVLTEKSHKLISEFNKYSFNVAKNANKKSVKIAFKEVFNIEPIAINIINVKPVLIRTGTKFPGKTQFVKKAIITLPKDVKLNIMGDEEQAKEAAQQEAATKSVESTVDKDKK